MVGLGVVGGRPYSQHRHNGKALSAPFLCVGFIVTVKIACLSMYNCFGFTKF
jgi:hypothetical protein